MGLLKRKKKSDIAEALSQSASRHREEYAQLVRDAASGCDIPDDVIAIAAERIGIGPAKVMWQFSEDVRDYRQGLAGYRHWRAASDRRESSKPDIKAAKAQIKAAKAQIKAIESSIARYHATAMTVARSKAEATIASRNSRVFAMGWDQLVHEAGGDS